MRSVIRENQCILMIIPHLKKSDQSYWQANQIIHCRYSISILNGYISIKIMYTTQVNVYKYPDYT